MDVNIRDFGVDCLGGDLAESVNYFSEIFKQMIKESLIGVLEDATVKSIQNIINNEIESTPPNTQLIN